MTAEEQALIDDIHADPRSDAPRLLYADWLEDHGAPEYAEFVRLQCEKPYVIVPTREGSWCRLAGEAKWDQAAADRRDRLLDLYDEVTASDRFASLLQESHYEELVRGLVVREVDDVDLGPPLTTDTPPLLRFRLNLLLTAGEIAAWLNDPIFRRVDVLRLDVYEKEFDLLRVYDSLRLVPNSALRHLEELNLYKVPLPLRDMLVEKTLAAGVPVSDDEWER